MLREHTSNFRKKKKTFDTYVFFITVCYFFIIVDVERTNLKIGSVEHILSNVSGIIILDNKLTKLVF